MSDVSNVTNLLATANEDFSSTLSTTVSAAADTLPLTSVTGLTNGTIFVGIIEPGTAKEQTFTGVVDTGGSQILHVEFTRGGDVPHTAGVSIVDYITGTAFNMLSRAIQNEHRQNGQHGNVNALTVNSSGAMTSNGLLTAAAGLNVSGGTVTLPNNSVPAASLAVSSATTTYTNPGSAGGTFYYMNLGGMKMFWGITGNVGTTSVSLTLPTGFFSNIQSITASNVPPYTNTTAAVGRIDSYSTTSVTLSNGYYSGNNPSNPISVTIIGN